MANTHSATFVRASTQQAEVASNLGITGGAITIEVWVKPTSTPSSGVSYLLAQLNESTADTRTWINYKNNAGTPQIEINRQKANVSNNFVTYNVTLSTTDWTHIALTYDTTDLKLYTAPAGGAHTLRGTLATSGNGAVNVPTNFTVGVGTNSSSNLDGELDDLRVWSVAKTIAELDTSFETELAGTESNLRAYYRLNNDWNDLTSNAYNLTTSGSPTFTTDVAFSAGGGGSPTPLLMMMGMGS